MQNIQYAQHIRVSCDLPINPRKSRQELQCQISKAHIKTVQEQGAPNCDDPVALGDFLFGGESEGVQ